MVWLDEQLPKAWKSLPSGTFVPSFDATMSFRSGIRSEFHVTAKGEYHWRGYLQVSTPTTEYIHASSTVNGDAHVSEQATMATKAYCRIQGWCIQRFSSFRRRGAALGKNLAPPLKGFGGVEYYGFVEHHWKYHWPVAASTVKDQDLESRWSPLIDQHDS